MTQLLIALFGLTAMACALSDSARLRRYAPLLGLAGQPAWFYFAWQSDGWGLAALCVAYTAVYARAAWKNLRALKTLEAT